MGPIGEAVGPSMLAFPTILTVHVLGTGFLAGASAAIAQYFGLPLLLGTVGLFDLRVLGLGKAVPSAAPHKSDPVRQRCRLNPKSVLEHALSR